MTPDPKPARRVRDGEALRCFNRDRECGSCGHGRGVEAHHIVSRAQGGDDVDANLFPLCAGCHGAVHGRPYRAYGVRIDSNHVRQAIARHIRSEAGDDTRTYLYRKLDVFGAEAFVQRLEAGGMVDLTLRCPVCGRRADMCFEHGDDWKKRRPGEFLEDTHKGTRYES